MEKGIGVQWVGDAAVMWLRCAGMRLRWAAMSCDADCDELCCASMRLRCAVTLLRCVCVAAMVFCGAAAV